VANSVKLLEVSTDSTPNPPKTIKLSYYFGKAKKWTIGNTALIHTFISGLKCSDRLIDVGLNLPTVDVGSSIISVDVLVSSQTKPV
jgi:hypothetical protein